MCRKKEEKEEGAEQAGGDSVSLHGSFVRSFVMFTACHREVMSALVMVVGSASGSSVWLEEETFSVDSVEVESSSGC